MNGLPLRLLKWVFLGLVALYLITPLAVVTGVSFNTQPIMNFPPVKPSLHWYTQFFSDAGWVSALEVSLSVALGASLLAGLIAFPIAYIGWKRASWLTRLLNGLGALPFMLPLVVLAVVFLVFWSWLGLAGHMGSTVVSHAMVFAAMPLAFITLGFSSIDNSLIESARTMGARDNEILRTIILPIVMPYVSSGLVFVFVSSLNEYIIAYLVAGFTVETLPIKVFNSLRMGFQPTMCVGAVLFMALGIAAFSLVARIGDLPKLLGGRA